IIIFTLLFFLFLFFKSPPSTEIYSLSLHDALPILVDDGPGFDGQLPDVDVIPDTEEERGRGLFMVQALVDECTIRSGDTGTVVRDRKSTRLNSSHVAISYAVFCLKKKTEVTSRLQQ